MKKFSSIHGRKWALYGVILLLAGLLGYVALRAGPMAPVAVTIGTVEIQSITPSLFGVGTVEARYTHKIGPTFAGRIKQVEVQSGDRVTKGQLLGEMDPIDLDDKLGAQEAALKRAEATMLAVEAQVQEVSARKSFAELQSKRYERLFSAQSVSEEGVSAKRQELQVAHASLTAARANLDASRQELIRARADRDGLVRQRANLRLVSPVDGIVTRRDADPGTTVVAGQSVVDVVEPGSIWVSVRFDQQRAQGLSSQLPAQIALRSHAGELLLGTVVRIEPHADAVTEEILAKVAFAKTPGVLPPIGELAEVTVALTKLQAMPVVPNASLQRVGGRLGVWLVENESLRFATIKIGASDLDGRVQILEGLRGGEHIVVHSFKALDASSHIKVVDHIAGKSS